MRFYVYCLSDELADARFEELTGVGGACVRLLPFGGVSAIASEFEGTRAPITRENLLAHNHINAHVLARVTPLPFRFGTLADEAGLSAYVASNESALAEGFARVRGCVEMGLKIRLDEGAAGGAEEAAVKVEEVSAVEVEEVNDEETCAAQETVTTQRVGAAGGGRGTAFLLAKRREILGGEALKARAEAAAARVAGCVEGVARESDVRLSPEGPIVLRASHLVAREDVSVYRARVRELGAGLEGMHMLASGPWPPYSFGVARV
jgi:hypothetical protein